MDKQKLTKREYIATQIAIGLSVQAIVGNHNTAENMSKEVPYAAVMIADALIKELEKTSIETINRKTKRKSDGKTKNIFSRGI